MPAIDRQATFSGTEAPPEHLALDVPRLAAYMADKIPELGDDFSVEKFKGGQSNPTYKLTGRDVTIVLRRRPPGKLLASAHAIDREYRVMEAVGLAGVPAPQTYFYCTDESIIGSEFYVVGFNEGTVYWNADMPGAAPADRAAVYEDMNGRIAQIHGLDYAAYGLGSLAKVGGYAARNLSRWSKIYADSTLVDIPDMDWLMDALPDMLPAEERVCLVHGDFGLYNVIVAPEEPKISAIIDWEMATLGDPFIDLAHHVRAWWEVPDPEGGAATSLKGMDVAALGIPTMDEYIDRYCRRMGLTELPHRRFYLGYAQFRNAAMVQGILKRAAIGTASSARASIHRQERVFEIAALARATLEGREA
ncbi:phosphotransferase family protein [Sphingobium sp. JS3065]|uniref:phosphotransferase family protein n=1 Tax=Sphingobium sp. JS3065 TaxID=2970925 RepID=UPI002263F4EC|nr:phosphotransferase family protein [Sphingobium sp. JS3065]UZW57066.1 phosphotransferase family protein [Sphingobium sp. JS3065]